MSSIWQVFDEVHVAARQAHAARIAAVAGLLDVFPQVSLVGLIASRSQVSSQTARAWVREAAELRELPDLTRA